MTVDAGIFNGDNNWEIIASINISDTFGSAKVAISLLFDEIRIRGKRSGACEKCAEIDDINLLESSDSDLPVILISMRNSLLDFYYNHLLADKDITMDKYESSLKKA